MSKPLQQALERYQATDYPAAQALCAHILAQEPEDIGAWHLLGLAYRQAGKALQAANALRRTVALKPDLAEAWFDLGDTLRLAGKTQESIAPYRQATTLAPDNMLAWFKYSNALILCGDHATAENASRHAIALSPRHAFLWITLGRSLVLQNRPEEAAQCMEEALRLQSNSLPALLELADIFEEWRMPAWAAQYYQRVLQRQPDHTLALTRLTDVSLALCDWRYYDRLCAELIARIERETADRAPITVDIFNLSALPISQSFIFTAAKAKAAAVSSKVKAAAHAAPSLLATPPSARIRLGYLLPYTSPHSMPLALEPVIERHDRQRFEVHGYALKPCSGQPFSRQFRRKFDHFADIGKRPAETAARQIQADGIDLLIDTTGHTAVNGLEILAHRPAPVQAHYLGYALTSGSDFIDYLITDKHVLPPEWLRWCSEQPVYLPHSFMATCRAPIDQAAIGRAEARLPSDALVFANFGHPCKLEPSIFALWMRLLRNLPNAVLWLGNWMHGTAENLRGAAEAEGIAAERLIFAPLLDHAKHLARLRLADLALDTRFHGGGVTTVDALWVGVPVLTLASETPASRLGASLAAAAGVPELVTSSLAEYEAHALALARNLALLRDMRRKLEAARDSSPLFDQDRYCRNLERGYERMWQNYRTGRPSERIDVQEGESVTPRAGRLLPR